MSLPQAVTAYVDARLAADAAPVWARLSSEDEAAHRMRELLAACFGASVALDDALIAHAPDFVRAQAERWRGMVELVEPPKVQAPEPIVVLGPWRQHPSGTWYRLHHGGSTEGARAMLGGYALRAAHEIAWPKWYGAGGGKEEADREARERGWVLLDAEPLPAPAFLEPWETIGCERRRYYCPREAGCVAIEVSQHGWRVRKPNGTTLAHGQQEGPEGERLAMAAAYALGFVEGAQ